MNKYCGRPTAKLHFCIRFCQTYISVTILGDVRSTKREEAFQLLKTEQRSLDYKTARGSVMSSCSQDANTRLHLYMANNCNVPNHTH